MPWAAASQVDQKLADGSGPAVSADGTVVTNLQMWYMIDHSDVNRATPTEFGYFMDGTTAPARDWATGEPKADKHYV